MAAADGPSSHLPESRPSSGAITADAAARIARSRLVDARSTSVAVVGACTTADPLTSDHLVSTQRHSVAPSREFQPLDVDCDRTTSWGRKSWGGGIRTLTVDGLSALPLPVGLRPHARRRL